MKTIGMFMAVLMVFSIFASAGIALAQGDEDYGEAEPGQQVEPVGIYPAGMPILVAGNTGVASSVEAVQVFPADVGVLDSNTFNLVIDEVDETVGESGRKVGFLRGTYGKGHFIDGDHLGFMQLLWVRALVTESETASDTVKKVAGRLKVDGEVYGLSHRTLDDDMARFDLTSVSTDKKGELTLELVDSYDDGERKVWEGSIEIGDIDGKVDLVTVTRSVRKASDREIQEEAPNHRIDGAIMPYGDESEGKNARSSGADTAVSNGEGKGIIRRIIDYFTAERA